MTNDNKRGSAGGKATALIQKENAKHRIDEYNKNPNCCKYCGNPILATYDKPLSDIKKKKFCNHSCATKYNNTVGDDKNSKNEKSIINNKTDKEVIECFYDSCNFSEFCIKLGYKSKCNMSNQSIINRLKTLNLNIDDLIFKKENVSNLSKGELFAKRTNWQNARSAIQKDARSSYKNSDKPKQCVVCGYDKHYEVAHIMAVSEFTDDTLISEINDSKNLIALCPNHHWEFDNNILNINTYLSDEELKYLNHNKEKDAS